MVDNMLTSLGNKRVKQKITAICDFINSNKTKTFYICSHDTPDPDSIASAMGILRIVNFLGVERAEIVYCGEISHPQNRAMSNVLTVPIKRWKQIEVDEDAIYIFVDCAQNQQRNMSIEAEPHIVIDHHKTTLPKNAICIHDEIGACSTLITDLLLNIPPIQIDDKQYFCFDSEADGMKELCTALAIGIKTDTVDFRSETTTDFDFQAYKMLTRFMNDEKFTQVINYELPPYMFDCEEIAWSNKKLESPNFITGLKFVDITKSDCIPYLADKFMRLQGIQTVVVYGVVGNSIRASVRTTSSSIDCGDLCSDIFGAGNGGAKHGIGGATVQFNVFDLTDLTDEEKEQFWELTRSQIERKFMKAIHK